MFWEQLQHQGMSLSQFPTESIKSSSLIDLSHTHFLLLDYRAGKEQLWEDTRWKKGFWCTLISAAADAIAIPSRGPSPVTFAALSCLKYFAEDSIFCDRVLKEVLVFLVLLPFDVLVCNAAVSLLFQFDQCSNV